jgi:hypothetical protein
MSVGLGLLALLVSTTVAHAAQSVGPEEILAAMQRSQGFDPTATTNGARFQAEVILVLARERRDRDPLGPPLFIGHAQWFSAFLARTGLAQERAPAFIRLAYEHGQDMEVDYQSEHVLQEAAEGSRPRLALNVRIWWPEPRGGSSYSYEDMLSIPHLKVTNKRLMSYRLLEFEDMLVFGEIEGLLGRPTSGVLGLLFQIIGEGQVQENRMTISRDGLQISHARARKAFFGVTSTVTVYPDGRTEKDLPAGRPDLAPLEARLTRPLQLSYRPLRAGPGNGASIP